MFKIIGKLFIAVVIFFAIVNGYTHAVNGPPTGSGARVWMQG